MKTNNIHMKKFLVVSVILCMGQIALAFQSDPERAEQHGIKVTGFFTNPVEGLVIGNGDLGATVNVFSHEFRLTIGKNDVWDARIPNKSEEIAIKHDDLIRYVEKNGLEMFTSLKWENKPPGKDLVWQNPAYGKNAMVSSPAPKRVGQIRFCFPGHNDTKVNTHLDIKRGILSSVFEFPNGSLIAETFIDRNGNVIWLKVTGKGNPPWFELILEKEPDGADPEMPGPEVQIMNQSTGVIRQTIPAGYGVPSFSWNMAAAFPEAIEPEMQSLPLNKMAYRIRQFCTMKDGQSAIMKVAVTTDRDTWNASPEATCRMLGEDPVAEYPSAREKHIESWAKFWAASSIQMEDKELESVWYRNMFGHACNMKAGAQAPGLMANINHQDYAEWHGDYHWNHNVQKWYVTALPNNHPEWINVYADLIDQMTPKFEYLAELIFGFDGVYVDHVSFPYVPVNRTPVNNSVGRSLALTGWAGQPLWWHWEYTGDREFLEHRSYPYLRSAAEFYSNYIDKYMKADNVIYPSVRLEAGGIHKDFFGNRNVLTDLVMFRNAFNWAIAASVELDVDSDLRERWKASLSRVKKIRYGWTEDDQGWVALHEDWTLDEIHDSMYNRWGGGGWFIFPGEYINGDEQEGIAEAARDMLENMDLHNPYGFETKAEALNTLVPKIHPISGLIPYIRLGLTGKYDTIRELILEHRMSSGQFFTYPITKGEMNRDLRGRKWYRWRALENRAQGVLVITEMLLQSQGKVIRLFPYWPTNQSASFKGFLARGGFEVSASWDPKEGLKNVRILSNAGQTCRIRWEENEIPEVLNGSKSIAVTQEGRDINFKTDKGKEYNFQF